jgi:nucleoside 2-deoxyribosyltransferase
VQGRDGVKIYIAASWKHCHAVEMLTRLLREKGHEVLSFVENNYGEQAGHLAVDQEGVPISIEEWIWSERGANSFEYDTRGAATADLVIYIGPSGMDAAAEVGIAWANGKPLIGLTGKDDQFGLMRRMVAVWAKNYREVLDLVDADPWDVEASEGCRS